MEGSRPAPRGRSYRTSTSAGDETEVAKADEGSGAVGAPPSRPLESSERHSPLSKLSPLAGDRDPDYRVDTSLTGTGSLDDKDINNKPVSMAQPTTLSPSSKSLNPIVSSKSPPHSGGIEGFPSNANLRGNTQPLKSSPPKQLGEIKGNSTNNSSMQRLQSDPVRPQLEVSAPPAGRLNRYKPLGSPTEVGSDQNNHAVSDAQDHVTGDVSSSEIDKNEERKAIDGNISNVALKPAPPTKANNINHNEPHSNPRLAHTHLKESEATSEENKGDNVMSSAREDLSASNNRTDSTSPGDEDDASNTPANNDDNYSDDNYAEDNTATKEFDDLDLAPPKKIDEFDPQISESNKTKVEKYPPSFLNPDPSGDKEYDMTAEENVLLSNKTNKVSKQMTALQSLQSSCRLSRSKEVASLSDPLHRAIAEGCEIDVRMLLEGNGDNASHALCSRDSLGRNAAHILCISQNLDILKLVMSTYKDFVYGQLMKQLVHLQTEKDNLLKPAMENPLKANYRNSVVKEWFEKQRYMMHRHAEIRIECWWLKIMSTRDRNGKTPISYAVSSNVSSAFLRRLFTTGRGSFSSSEDNQFKFRNVSYKLPFLFSENAIYDSNSGKDLAECGATPTFEADSKSKYNDHSVTRSISFEVSSNPTISVKPGSEDLLFKPESKTNWDILLPWLYRNILKRANESRSSTRDSKEADSSSWPISPQDKVLKHMQAFDPTHQGFILLHEFRQFLSKLGIVVTVEVLRQLCLLYPGDAELTKAKWQRKKSEFAESLMIRQEMRRNPIESGSKGDKDSGSKQSKDSSESRSTSADKSNLIAESKASGDRSSSDFKLAKELKGSDFPKRFQDEDEDSNELYISDPYLEEERDMSIDINTFIRVLKTDAALKGLDISVGGPNPTVNKESTLNKSVEFSSDSSNYNTVTVSLNSPPVDLPSVVSKSTIKELRRSLVNIPDIEGWTPLVIASKNGNHSLIADLLEMGADIMRLGPEGLSALSVAATLPVKNSLDKSLVDQLTSSFGESVNHNVRSSYNSKEKSLLFDKFVPQIASLKDKNWAYGKGPVGYAALNGLRSSVAQLLASGLKANDTDIAGRSALHELSVFVKNAKNASEIMEACEILDVLAKGGANINLTSVSRRNALHELFCRSQDDAPSSFKVNDKVFQTKSSDYSVLIGNTTELYSKRRAYINKLLDLGVNAEQLDRSGYSATHYCAKEGYVEDMLALLLHGCDPRIKTKAGYTSLHIACANGNYDIASLIARWDGDSCIGNSITVARGGDDKVAGQLFPRKPPQYCLDTLWSACRQGQSSKVAALLSSLSALFPLDGKSTESCSWLQAKIDAKTRVFKLTAMHTAILGCAEVLLDKGYSKTCQPTAAAVYSSKKLSISLSPIYKAFNNKRPKLGESRNGRIWNGISKNCREVLDIYNNVLMTLLTSGAFIDSFDLNLRTPLMYAAALNLSPLVETLIGNGANPNLTDSDGNSALHLGYMYGATDTVLILERHKCEQILNKNKVFPMEVIDEFQAYTPLLFLEKKTKM